MSTHDTLQPAVYIFPTNREPLQSISTRDCQADSRSAVRPPTRTEPMRDISRRGVRSGCCRPCRSCGAWCCSPTVCTRSESALPCARRTGRTPAVTDSPPCCSTGSKQTSSPRRGSRSCSECCLCLPDSNANVTKRNPIILRTTSEF